LPVFSLDTHAGIEGEAPALIPLTEVAWRNGTGG
jgi:hypothetical protein